MANNTYLNRLYPIVSVVIPLMYLAGVVGLSWSYTLPLFKLLVPFHLITSVVLLLLYDESNHKTVYFFYIFVFIISILVEAVGIRTGAIFGQYMYGDTLGWKIFNVPILIGANWLLLIYCTGVVLDNLSANALIKSLVGAAIVVLLDYLIEPVAIDLDFWNWHDSTIPPQNYIAWYILSILLLLLFYILPFSKKNRLASLLLYCQFLFFVAHNLLALTTH